MRRGLQSDQVKYLCTSMVNGVTLMPSRSLTKRFVAASLLLAVCTGCQNMNKTEKGALVGGAGGAAVGAIVGKQLGSTGGGAAIGALTGGALGGLIGNSEDEADKKHETEARQAAYNRAAYAQQRAITNSDVVAMAQANVSEDIICNEIRTRGGRFDTRPQAIIQLQQNGVSNKVIEQMQNYSAF